MKGWTSNEERLWCWGYMFGIFTVVYVVPILFITLRWLFQ